MNAGSQTLFLRFFPIKKRPNCQKRTFGSSAVFFGKTRRFPSPPHEGFSFDYGSLTCHIVERYPPEYVCQLISIHPGFPDEYQLTSGRWVVQIFQNDVELQISPYLINVLMEAEAFVPGMNADSIGHQ